MQGGNLRGWIGAAVGLMMGAFTASAQAQLVPWRVFSDPDSTSNCDVVNAANVELVVLLDSDALVIVTATDTELVNTEVTSDGEVLLNGDSFGFIEFAADADGFRTLWWVSLTGRAVEVDGLSGEPSESNLSPADFGNVPCDACPFWDDGTICNCGADADCDDTDECTLDICDPIEGCSHATIICTDDDPCTEDVCDVELGCVFAEIVCDDDNPCTDEACVGGVCVVADLDVDCDDRDACTIEDQCFGGECIGIDTACNDNDPCTEDSCDGELGCVFAEIVCDDDNECTDEGCVAGVCVAVDNVSRCNDGDRCTSNDRCLRGECVGTPVTNCDSGGPIIVLCGDSAGMIMLFSFLGLAGTGMARRRNG